MSYIKYDTHLDNSQWRIDKRVTDWAVMNIYVSVFAN